MVSGRAPPCVAAVVAQLESVVDVDVVGDGAKVVAEEPLPFGLAALSLFVNVLPKLVGRLLLFVAAFGAPMPPLAMQPLAMPPGNVLRLLAMPPFLVSRVFQQTWRTPWPFVPCG